VVQVECEGCQVHNLNCEWNTAALHGFHTDGFFAEYAAVDYRNAIILPENLETETSAPYFCAGITGPLSSYLFYPLTY
jgi:propanol-preferring alcohol dehydrogenase